MQDPTDLTQALAQTGAHRGSNQIGVKHYNERLVISLIQNAGPLSKAEIARITKLSPQTVTIIVNRLIDDGFLSKAKAVRGKVGQPSTPIQLNRDGALSLGIKIGRRSLDLVILSLDRQTLARQTHSYDYPDCDHVFALIQSAARDMVQSLTQQQQARLVGVGVAAPSGIDGWEGVIGAPPGVLARWKDVDIRSRIENLTGLPATLLNDTSAACLAEADAGIAQRFTSVCYFYVGTFVGGGLVVEGQLYSGQSGNAAAIGSLPLGLRRMSPQARPMQLIEAASLHRLEQIAKRKDLSLDHFQTQAAVSPTAQSLFKSWSALAADALACAALQSAAFLDPEAIIIDAGLSRPLLRRLVDQTRDQLAGYNLEGLTMPDLYEGSLGSDARALGAAMVPLRAHFSADNKSLLKG